MLTRFLAAGIFLISAMQGYAQAPGDAELNRAYQAAAQKNYDAAIEFFTKGLALQPQNAGAHKDFAYTLLKAGENSEARDEFETALHLNPNDETAALEYAFLAFETKQPIEARRMFDHLRRKASVATQTTAEQAFQNIDRPLAEGIARWKEALARSANPNDISMFSAHWELGQLAELRDELPLAAEQYEICRRLKPQMEELLLILARVWRPLNRADEARAALLAASRSQDSRTAELALQQLDARYPYPYEFLNALKLDPENVTLRRELAYLYLAMHKESEASEQFQRVLEIDPKDQLSRDQLDALRGFKKRSQLQAAPASTQATGTDAKAMGKKSLGLGYLNDAIKYLRQAHEEDPRDAEVMLQLGWAYNLAKDDGDAKHWFDLARHSEDAQVAAQAGRAFRNLEGDVGPQTTFWALPMYSSRWNDLFTYGQVKRTVAVPWLKKGNKLFSFYLSTRFMGDVRGQVITPFGPGYLSENSFIVGVGVASKTWHHLTGWAEAGAAISYLPNTGARATPDYRGGVNFAKGFGSLLGSHTPGLFYETTADAIYVSRFDKDWLFYSQHRAGRTISLRGHSSAQLYFNFNYTQDVKSEHWADTVEIGPGVKLHLPWMPRNVFAGADFLRGVYTTNACQVALPCAWRPNYNDIRVGFWYAITKK